MVLPFKWNLFSSTFTFIEYVVLTFESVDEIPWCYHSNETSLSELSKGAIYLRCSSKFWVWGWNTMVLPFRWNLLGRTFEWCHLSISYSFGIFAKIYWSAFLWLSVNDLLSTLIPLISLFFLILLEACAWSFYLTRMSWQKSTSLLTSREIKVISPVVYLVRMVSVAKYYLLVLVAIG